MTIFSHTLLLFIICYNSGNIPIYIYFIIWIHTNPQNNNNVLTINEVFFLCLPLWICVCARVCLCGSPPKHTISSSHLSINSNYTNMMTRSFGIYISRHSMFSSVTSLFSRLDIQRVYFIYSYICDLWLLWVKYKYIVVYLRCTQSLFTQRHNECAYVWTWVCARCIDWPF